MAKKETATVEQKTEAEVEKPLTLLEINQRSRAVEAKLGDLAHTMQTLCAEVRDAVKAAFDRGEDVTKLTVVVTAGK